MTIRVESNYSEIEDELDRLSKLPDEPRSIARLEATLDELLAITKADTHVITGSLKASGRADSHVTESTWTGTITYGGPAPGFPHDPVRYAKYERGRGETHDFLRGAYMSSDTFLEAIRKSLAND